MIGMSESDIFGMIEQGTLRIPHLSTLIMDQPALIPGDILRKIAAGVAMAIAANNAEIEKQLRQRQ